MIKIINYKDLKDDFFNGRDFGSSIDIVKDILLNVKTNGDKALLEYGTKFDVSAPSSLEIPQSELKAAAQKMQKENPELYKSLCYSHDLALRFAKKQRESFDNFEVELEPGLFTGQKNIPVEKAGVYVPAGRFPLVSTVVMTVTPAVAAGVKDIVLCTPPRVHPEDRAAAQKAGTGIPGSPFVGGKPYADENIMAAAYICGVTKAYACGGAQAIGALAFGTQSIPRTDVIVGPGNKFVSAAKKAVYGKVGIDMVAGPTEVLIIADESASPEWVASDLLAQAEHDVVAQPVLVTKDRNFAISVQQEIEKQLAKLSTAKTARESIDNSGYIVIVNSIEEACSFANRKAPEHLELAMKNGKEREKAQNLVRNYGSLFIGHNCAEVFGDYAAGLNHTLPTNGAAHYSGGLSVRVFLKTVTTLRADEKSEGVKKSAKAAGFLGDAEGLEAHANAARIRL